MAEANWTETTNNLGTGDVDRGVTAGITPPNGGSSFVYGFHSQAVVDGAAALFTNQSGFAPTTKGGRISGAVKRHLSAGATGWAPFLFLCLGGPDITDTAYMLGLSDASPSKIILRKGPLDEGFPNEAPGTAGTLAIGTASVDEGDWVHLRMDIVVNLNNDVIINVMQSDVDTNAVTAPVWVVVPGMDVLDPGSGQAYFDDALGVNSGSQPLLLGRGGFGCRFEDTARRSFFDHIEVARQV